MSERCLPPKDGNRVRGDSRAPLATSRSPSAVIGEEPSDDSVTDDEAEAVETDATTDAA